MIFSKEDFYNRVLMLQYKGLSNLLCVFQRDKISIGVLADVQDSHNLIFKEINFQD